jgi:hypothetical protein
MVAQSLFLIYHTFSMLRLNMLRQALYSRPHISDAIRKPRLDMACYSSYVNTSSRIGNTSLRRAVHVSAREFNMCHSYANILTSLQPCTLAIIALLVLIGTLVLVRKAILKAPSPLQSHALMVKPLSCLNGHNPKRKM